MSNYTISVPASSIQKAISYGANVSVTGSGVSFPDGTTVTSVASSVIVPDLAYAQANVATGIATGAYTQANAGIAFTQGVYDFANTIGGGSAIDNVARQIAISARANTIIIQGVNETQNTWISSNVTSLQSQISANVNSLNGINDTQNTRIQSIETINTNQNTSISIIQGVDNTQNVEIAGIQGVDLAQNTSISTLNSQIITNQGINDNQNTRIQSIETINNDQNNTIIQVNQFAAGAFDFANVSSGIQSGINETQNTAISIIQGVDLGQNTTITQVNQFTQSAYNQANNTNTFGETAFARANTSANSFVGTSGSASPSLGIVTFSSTNGMSISGLGSTLTIDSSQDIRTSASPTFNGLNLTNALPLTQGGTGSTSAASALTTLLPTGTTSGYVLTTGGPGTFYWSASGGGGSGATPGTTINSTRLSYTANGTGLSYTTPTYIPGASQLRVYFDGLRQFASGYTETNSTTVTFNTSPASGVIILIEVDGYINNPYYANTIAFTAPFGGIVSTANTIQLAIQDVETRKSTIASPAFTGIVTAPTPSIDTSNTQIATTAFVRSILPTGVILMWSGSVATIPTGWYLCDGTNSTPDLRNRFIVGAGNTYAVAGTGGSADSVVPAHSHTASSSTSTSISDPGHIHTFSQRGDDGQGTGAGYGVVGYNANIGAGGGDMVSATTGITASSSTSTTVNSTGVSATNTNLPPYYALAYIMKA